MQNQDWRLEFPEMDEETYRLKRSQWLIVSSISKIIGQLESIVDATETEYSDINDHIKSLKNSKKVIISINKDLEYIYYLLYFKSKQLEKEL